MSWTSQRWIRVGFWLLTLLPAFLGFLTFQNVRSLIDAAQDVEHTNDIEKRLERLLSRLKDVELAQRGFLLTADERFAADLHNLRASIYNEVNEVSKVTRDQHWFELLNVALGQKLEEIDQSMNVRRNEGIEAATEIVKSDAGNQPMDSIRIIFRNLMESESRQLKERSANQRSRFIETMTLFSLALLLNILLLMGMGYLVRREAAHTQALNVELERRVALRTEALQRSNEDLQQFAYVASHDLKEPMRMVSTYSTLLQRKYAQLLVGEGEIFLGFIGDGVRRMNALIEDLLEYSRAGEVREELVESATTVQSALDNLKATIAESGARITVETLPAVNYDSVRLLQVFQNLLGNAIKYRGDRRPVIRVFARQQETETVFSVEDNGIGIEPQYLEQVFGIFKRLHGKEYEGTGIGLAMVKKIVERHGGRIWAESVPGKGSTFSFSVPFTLPTGDLS